MVQSHRLSKSTLHLSRPISRRSWSAGDKFRLQMCTLLLMLRSLARSEVVRGKRERLGTHHDTGGL